MQLFYSDNITSNTITLDAEEARHCMKVLRKKVGDTIQVVDGKGSLYHCTITKTGKKHCTAKIDRKQNQYGKRDYHLSIAIAPTKNINRFEWFLEKATEIGIDTIQPVIAKHSERKRLKTDRLNKILVSAMKQSGKAYLPELKELITIGDFFKSFKENVQKFIATCEVENAAHLKDHYKIGSDAMILIGPEGDFSTEEIRRAQQAEFEPISLGESRLRVETAGIVACHTISLMNEVSL